VRRHAHGNANWITTHTTSIEVELALDGGPTLTVIREDQDDQDDQDDEPEARS
jgi:hypothetical protein